MVERIAEAAGTVNLNAMVLIRTISEIASYLRKNRFINFRHIMLRVLLEVGRILRNN